MQVVVLLLVLGLCSVEGMRKRKRNRNQQQGRRGEISYNNIYWSCGNEIFLGGTSHYLPLRTLSAKNVLFWQLPYISIIFPSGF